MKNKLTDLSNHLFEEMERLNDEDLEGEKLIQELSRAKAMSGIAQNIIMNAKLALDATRLTVEYGSREVTLPAMLTEGPKENG
jgi:hypothetical protein